MVVFTGITYDLFDMTKFDINKKVATTTADNYKGLDTEFIGFAYGADNFAKDPYNYKVVCEFKRTEKAEEKKPETPIDLDEEMELDI